MESLRIQKGRLRGRKIKPPPPVSGNSHLTLNLVKEAIFQVIEGRLGPDLEQYAFFDLCAGSGQMAFEAFSRGFSAVHLAEVDARRLSHLISEAKRGEFEVQIHRRDFRRMAPLVFRHPKSIVFLDPPYSFWKGGESDAVDRLVHNLAHPSDESRALLDGYRKAGQAFDLWFIVHGPGEYTPPVPSEPGSSALYIAEHERRDYRKQRISILHFALS
ncbi:MAG: RsmD family RNA methyltransferase [bacterium]|nr:RsmD family RNA methyltransferase [bacterium]